MSLHYLDVPLVLPQAVHRLSGPDSDAVSQCQWLLACLRAQYWSYQQSHWQVLGDAAYGNHLLFQRLYESVIPQVDTLAEKMVGTYGPRSVDNDQLEGKFQAWLKRWNTAECLHKRGLKSEAEFQFVCKKVYNELKDHNELSLGMDDFLMATANDHETNQYLLRQVLRQPE